MIMLAGMDQGMEKGKFRWWKGGSIKLISHFYQNLNLGTMIIILIDIVLGALMLSSIVYILTCIAPL